MKQVVQNLKSGKTELTIVPEPQCGAGEILVRTEASLISAGTEKMLMDFAGKSLLGKAQERPDLVQKVITKMQRDGVADTLKSVFLRLDEPMPLGYSAAGTVLKVGSKLAADFKVGDRVAVAGAGLANHAEVNAVPRNLAVKLPDSVPAEHGAYATLAAIALQGVRQAGVNIGDRVLVVGLGLVGQLVAQLARAAGAQVAALETNASRAELATEAGVHLVLNPANNPAAAFNDFTDGRGFDSILLCAASESNAIISQAADWARDRATVVLVGKVGTGFPYAAYMKKELTVKTSRSYGPGRYDPAYEQGGVTYPVGYVPHTERDHLAEVVRHMAAGTLNVGLLTSHVFTFDDALDAYGLLNGKVAKGEKQKPVMGIVLHYPQPKKTKETAATTLVLKPKNGVLNVGVIGTGAFAKGMLLPALAATPGVKLAAFASKQGLSAAQCATRYEGTAAPSAEAILDDRNIHAVIISTRHNTHAEMVKKALLAGKHVWIEKPVAMTRKELAEVQKAYAEATKKHGFTPILMVGFNRRFAPAVQAIRTELDKTPGPRQVLVRVNAGRLEPSWQHTPEGGGRLVGEVCHFSDLAICLQESPVTGSTITTGAGQDVYTLVLTHENGGVSTIMYSSEGDPAAAKEYAEVFAGGAIYMLNNYASATVSRSGKTKNLFSKPKLGGTNKGHAAALAAWAVACAGKAEAPVPVAELFASSAITLPE